MSAPILDASPSGTVTFFLGVVLLELLLDVSAKASMSSFHEEWRYRQSNDLPEISYEQYLEAMVAALLVQLEQIITDPRTHKLYVEVCEDMRWRPLVRSAFRKEALRLLTKSPTRSNCREQPSIETVSAS